MSEPIVYIDHSAIHEGRLEEVKLAIHGLATLVESSDIKPLAYKVYLNEDATRMTVIHVHADSTSLEHLMKVAGPAFPEFRELISLETIDVYGGVNEPLLELLQDKAKLLGGATVAIHDPEAGFARFADR
jgi:hypothetical protein